MELLQKYKHVIWDWNGTLVDDVDNYAASKIAIGKVYMDKIGLQSKEVVLIGDTSHDYEVACALKCECILVANGHQSFIKIEKVQRSRSQQSDRFNSRVLVKKRE